MTDAVVLADSARMLWLALYFEQIILAAFVVFWWGGTVLLAWRQGRPITTHYRLMIGMALVAAATAGSRTFWLPAQYYHGLFQSPVANAYSRDSIGWFLAFATLMIIGYVFHVITATSHGNRRLIWGGFIAINAAGLVAWWWLGGFGFTYI